MSLSAHEQHVLHTIEEQLTCSDPKLASLLATFTRLASGEEMPIRERLRAGWWRATLHQPAYGRPRRNHPRHHDRHPQRRIGWQQFMLLLWLVSAIALAATALAVSRGNGKASCNQPLAVKCVSHSSTHPHTAAPGTPPRLSQIRWGIRSDIATTGHRNGW